MRTYIRPEMERIEYALEDIITASGAVTPEPSAATLDLASVQWESDAVFDDHFFDE